MKNLTGVYKALVTDTSCFKETGKIKTRVSIFNNFFIEKDLLDKYNKDDYEDSVVTDRLTFILSPYGGGYNCGMFALPQVNSQGLVSFIDGNLNLPIWMGSLNSIEVSGSFLEQSDVPSDILIQEKSSVDFDTENEETKRNIEDKNSFVIRTKTNELDQNNLDDFDKMNWRSNPTENGLVMSKKHFQIIHKDEEASFSGLTMNNKQDYSIDLSHKIIEEGIIDESGEVDEEDIIDKSSVKLGRKGFLVEVKSETKEITIDANDKIRLFLKKDGQETEIYQDENRIILKNSDCVIEIKQPEEGGSNEINISAPTIRLDSKNIMLGAGSNRVVTSSSDFTMTLEDGTILNSAKNVRL